MSRIKKADLTPADLLEGATTEDAMAFAVHAGRAGAAPGGAAPGFMERVDEALRAAEALSALVYEGRAKREPDDHARAIWADMACRARAAQAGKLPARRMG